MGDAKIKTLGTQIGKRTFTYLNMLVLAAGIMSLAVSAYFAGATLSHLSPVDVDCSYLMFMSAACAIAYGYFSTLFDRLPNRFVFVFNLLILLASIVLGVFWSVKMHAIQQIDIENLIKDVFNDGYQERHLRNKTYPHDELETTKLTAVPTVLKQQVQNHFQCCGYDSILEYCLDPEMAKAESLTPGLHLNDDIKKAYNAKESAKGEDGHTLSMSESITFWIQQFQLQERDIDQFYDGDDLTTDLAKYYCWIKDHDVVDPMDRVCAWGENFDVENHGCKTPVLDWYWKLVTVSRIFSYVFFSICGVTLIYGILMVIFYGRIYQAVRTDEYVNNEMAVKVNE